MGENGSRKVEIVAIGNDYNIGTVALCEGRVIGFGSIASKCGGWAKPKKRMETREMPRVGTHFRFFKDEKPGNYLGQIKGVDTIPYMLYSDISRIIIANERRAGIIKGLEAMACFRHGHPSIREILDPSWISLNKVKEELDEEIRANLLETAIKDCQDPNKSALGVWKDCLEVEGGYKGLREVLREIASHVHSFGITTSTTEKDLQKRFDLVELRNMHLIPLTEEYAERLAKTSLAEFSP